MTNKNILDSLTEKPPVQLQKIFGLLDSIPGHPSEEFDILSLTFQNITENILNEPSELKHRKIQVQDNEFFEPLWSYKGVPELFYSMGFLYNGEYIFLPMESDLSKLKETKKHFQVGIGLLT